MSVSTGISAFATTRNGKVGRNICQQEPIHESNGGDQTDPQCDRSDGWGFIWRHRTGCVVQTVHLIEKRVVMEVLEQRHRNDCSGGIKTNVGWSNQRSAGYTRSKLAF